MRRRPLRPPNTAHRLLAQPVWNYLPRRRSFPSLPERRKILSEGRQTPYSTRPPQRFVEGKTRHCLPACHTRSLNSAYKSVPGSFSGREEESLGPFAPVEADQKSPLAANKCASTTLKPDFHLALPTRKEISRASARSRESGRDSRRCRQ